MTTVAVPFNASTTLLSYVTNGGKQDHKGVEFSVRYTALESSKGFIKSLTPFANFTYSDFKELQRIINIISLPRATRDLLLITADMRWQRYQSLLETTVLILLPNRRLYANITYFYKDKMPITSDGINWATSYSLLNTKLGFSIVLQGILMLMFSSGVKQHRHIKYRSWFFANQLPDAYIVAPPKANFFGGLNVKYNF